MIDRLPKALVGLLLCGASATFGATTLSQFPPSAYPLAGGGWEFKGTVSGQGATGWTTGSTFGNPPGQRAWVNGVYGGVPKSVATNTGSLVAKAGAMQIGAASTVLGSNAVAAVGRCVLSLNPYCAAGTAAYVAYQAYRAKPPGDVPGSTVPADQFDYDPGTDEVMVQGWSKPNAWGGSCGTTIYGTTANSVTAQACACYAQAPTDPGKAYQCEDWTDTQFTRRHYWTGNDSTISRTVHSVNPVQTNIPQCPASIDFENPAYSVPAGQPKGPDGKCPTSRYNHIPQTVEQMRDRFVSIIANGQTWTGWLPAVSDAIDKGGQEVPADITTSGPASQVGTPEQIVTTNPDGSSVTQTKTPTYNYSYPDNRVTYTTTNTTTVQTCTGAGSCTTGPTTVVGGGGAPAPQDPLDPCTANPGRAGCSDLGTPPTDKPVSTTKDIVYTPETVNLQAFCPQPFSFVVHGWTLGFSYQMACDNAPVIRLAILAIAAFGAASMIALTCARS